VPLTISTQGGGVPKDLVIQALFQHATIDNSAAAFAAQMCDVLDAAHNKGIRHRI